MQQNGEPGPLRGHWDPKQSPPVRVNMISGVYSLSPVSGKEHIQWSLCVYLPPCYNTHKASPWLWSVASITVRNKPLPPCHTQAEALCYTGKGLLRQNTLGEHSQKQHPKSPLWGWTQGCLCASGALVGVCEPDVVTAQDTHTVH